MNQREFEWMHQAQMEIMDEIHNICVQEGICYYLIAGSAIGALRHHGFIPWDIDIDCAMPRADYEKFKEACACRLNPRFKYFDFLSVKNYSKPHAVIGIVGTELYRKYDKYNPKELQTGIYVDVFPLDWAPDTEEERSKHAERIQKIKRKIYIKRHYNYSSSPIKRFGKWVKSLRYVTVSINQLYAELDKEMRYFENSETHYLCSMAGRHPYENECSPSEWFGTPVLSAFENREYFIPQQADKYLRKMYGDYLKLPPESERIADMSHFDRVVFDKKYE